MAEVLPNAPLVEVVFEVRWGKLNSQPLDPFPSDPGYPILCEEFTRAIRKSGYRHVVEVNPGMPISLMHSVGRRFYQSEKKLFPLVQIGSGIFAANESTGYEWKKFKALCLKNLKILIDTYPKTSSIELKPTLLELRYLDMFPAESDDGKRRDVFEFIDQETNLGISRPSVVEKLELVRSLKGGRIIAEYDLKKAKETVFRIEIFNGQNDARDIVRLDSKVQSRGKDVPKLKSKATFLKSVEVWLENAHSLTSPFFEEMVKPSLLRKFE